MSASFDIQSSLSQYSVHVASESFDRHLVQFGSVAAIVDQFFQPLLIGSKLTPIFVEATEKVKSLDTAPSLIEVMRRSGANRQTELVAIGGGVIQDLSAFIASIYMRGISWSYVPTTLLAMVDSCIGGKSSINVGPYKNLVGTFHPPRQIFIDPAFVTSLPDEQKASGLIEAAKICYCRGNESFEKHLSCKPSTDMETDALEQVIVNSLLSKKWFIEIDEFDQGERLLLNFGHTFGHALEGASHFKLSHGVAVGLGILCALNFQRQHGVTYKGIDRVAKLEDHLDLLIRTVSDLSTVLVSISLDDVIERFRSDKKHGANYFSLILVSENGDVVLSKVNKSEEAESQIKRSINSTIERYA